MNEHPLDATKLPCDIRVGAGTIRKGCTLRALVVRMEALHRAAFGDESNAIALLRQLIAERHRTGTQLNALDTNADNFLRDHDALVAQLAGIRDDQPELML